MNYVCLHERQFDQNAADDNNFHNKREHFLIPNGKNAKTTFTFQQAWERQVYSMILLEIVKCNGV